MQVCRKREREGLVWSVKKLIREHCTIWAVGDDLINNSMNNQSYLYWYVFQTTEEVVTVEAVQIITVVGLKKHFHGTYFYLQVSTHRLPQSSLCIEWDDVHLVRDLGLGGPSGGDSGGRWGWWPAGGRGDVRELVALPPPALPELGSSVEDGDHQDWTEHIYKMAKNLSFKVSLIQADLTSRDWNIKSG